MEGSARRIKKIEEIVTQQLPKKGLIEEEPKQIKKKSFFQKCCPCIFKNKQNQQSNIQQQRAQKVKVFKRIKPLNNQDQVRKTLILDLDETLIHATFQQLRYPDHILNVIIEGYPYRFYIKKRPYVEEFIQQMSLVYELIVFTASLKEYADQVINLIDPHKLVSYRLYRKDCSFINNNYIKDLNRIPRDLKDQIILDNNKNCFLMHPENGFLIKNFYKNSKDNELQKLIPFLNYLSNVNDVRDIRMHHKLFQKQKPFKYLNMQKEVRTWEPPANSSNKIINNNQNLIHLIKSTDSSQESIKENMNMNQSNKSKIQEERNNQKKNTLASNQESSKSAQSPKATAVDSQIENTRQGNKKLSLNTPQNETQTPKSQNSYFGQSPKNVQNFKVIDTSAKLKSNTIIEDDDEEEDNGELSLKDQDENSIKIQEVKNYNIKTLDQGNFNTNNQSFLKQSKNNNTNEDNINENLATSDVPFPQVNILDIQIKNIKSNIKDFQDKEYNFQNNQIYSNDNSFTNCLQSNNEIPTNNNNNFVSNKNQLNLNLNNNLNSQNLNSTIQEVTEYDDDKTPATNKFGQSPSKFSNQRMCENFKLSLEKQQNSEKNINEINNNNIQNNYKKVNVKQDTSEKIEKLVTIESVMDDNDNENENESEIQENKKQLKNIIIQQQQQQKTQQSSAFSQEQNQKGKIQNPMSSSMKKMQYNQTHSFNTIYLDNITKSQLSQSHHFQNNNVQQHCSPQKNVSEHTKNIMIQQLQQNSQQLESITSTQILRNNYFQKNQTSTVSMDNNTNSQLNQNPHNIKKFSQNLINFTASDNQSFVNDLEPEKNWRDILDINSPKISKQREFIFSKTATLSDNQTMNNNTPDSPQRNIFSQQKLKQSNRKKKYLERVANNKNKKSKNSSSSNNNKEDENNEDSNTSSVNDSNQESEEINSVNHKVEQEGQIGVVSDTMRYATCEQNTIQINVTNEFNNQIQTTNAKYSQPKVNPDREHYLQMLEIQRKQEEKQLQIQKQKNQQENNLKNNENQVNNSIQQPIQIINSENDNDIEIQNQNTDNAQKQIIQQINNSKQSDEEDQYNIMSLQGTERGILVKNKNYHQKQQLDQQDFVINDQ